ncbi:MAG: hypothetical protein LBS18_08270 [Clostridiales bacterium]|jgi:hypothetical protein|nr:hypothetical protein [Clostridiales bacterium]
MEKRTRRILLIVAGAILALALLWSVNLNISSESGRFAAYLRDEFGYVVDKSDIYPAGQWPDTTIRALFPDTDLDKMREASRQAGLPSEVDRRGDITLLLVNAAADDVLTLFVVDGEVTVGFVQNAATGAITPFRITE